MDESCFSLLSIPGLVEIEIRLEKQTMNASIGKRSLFHIMDTLQLVLHIIPVT